MNLNKTAKEAFEYVAAVAGGISGEVSPNQAANTAGNAVDYLVASAQELKPNPIVAKK